MKQLLILFTLLISFSSISQVGTFTFNTLTIHNVSNKEIVNTKDINTNILLDLNNDIIVLSYNDKVIYYSTNNNSFTRTITDDNSFNSILLKDIHTGEIIRLCVMVDNSVIIMNKTYLFSLYNKPN